MRRAVAASIAPSGRPAIAVASAGERRAWCSVRNAASSSASASVPIDPSERAEIGEGSGRSLSPPSPVRYAMEPNSDRSRSKKGRMSAFESVIRPERRAV
jgi:hypothetical protein